MSRKEVTNWDELPLMLTTTETSKIFRFDVMYIKEMCKAKEIPCFWKGMRIRIPKEGLKKYIEQLSNKSPAEQ